MQHYFNTEIARRFGVIPAIVAQNLWYWVRQNEKHNKNCFDGRWWVYESVREMSEVLCYLTHNQVRAALDKLEKCGIIIKGNFNKTRYDRTTWYSFSNEGYGIFAKVEMEIAKSNKQSV